MVTTEFTAWLTVAACSAAFASAGIARRKRASSRKGGARPAVAGGNAELHGDASRAKDRQAGGCRTGKRRNGKRLRSAHMAMGVAALALAAVHGGMALLWGSSADMLAAKIVSGGIALGLLAALAAVYGLRKRLGKRWLPVHNALALSGLAMTVVHVAFLHAG